MGVKQPNGIQDILPLSPLQEGLLFESGTATGDDVYVGQIVLTLDGALDTARLRTAAEQLLVRHPNLRAGFRYRKTGEPVAVIPRIAELPWNEVEASDPEPALAEARAQRFDLAKGPLIRFTVITSGTDKHLLAVTNHHLILDGWSTPILARELFDLYQGRSLPAVRPYRDYLGWLSKQDRTAAEAEWRNALAGYEPVRIGEPGTAAPQTHTVRLNAQATAALTALAKTHGCTLNTVVQAAWGLLIAHLTGRDDVVFGQTVSGRPPELPGVESMVGLFVTTVPVRVQVSPGDTVVDLLNRISDEQAGLFGHHHLGLPAIQRVAGGDLFDTLIVYENYPSDAADDPDLVPGLRIAGVDGKEATHYPLSLAASPGDELTLDLGYRPDVITNPAAVAHRLLRIFEGIAAGGPVGSIDVLADDERAQILNEWSGIGGTVPDRLITDVFADRVRETPEATALVTSERAWTFAELDAETDRLARALDVKPEQIVGLQLPRRQMVLGILAVLKAGAAYLPLDPDYPADRLALMIEDAKPALVLTSLDLDGDSISVRPNSGNAAYVIYTSGSTGRPKGVVATHAGLINTFADRAALVRKGHVKALHTAPFAFDGSWGTLLLMFAGHELHVLDEADSKDAEFVARYVAEHEIGFLDVTPSYLGALIDQGLLDSRPQLVVAGEATSPHLWEQISEFADDRYGPTEATIDTYGWSGPNRNKRPTINVRSYVLDARLRPVPGGSAGELYIAGPSVTRGYLNQPALTSSRFIACPFTGGRMYRTGDLARWREDGVLQILGRTDNQVKLRGFRIELGEIEAVLATHPGVSQAAVTVRDGRMLVAYVVGSARDLASFATDKLPAHMVPQTFVELDALPLTPNGKLDARALPAPVMSSSDAAPQTDAERTLCTIFATVLGLPDVGVNDDFFSLGGDSLLSIQVASRARAEGLALSPRDVFRNRTVAGLAALTRKEITEQASPAVSANGPVPLTPIMHGLLELGGSIDAVAQTTLVQTPAGLTVQQLNKAFASVIQQHPILRARLVREPSPHLDIPTTGTAPEVVIVDSPERLTGGPLAPERGIMLSAQWCESARQLLLTVHHLVIDAVSWQFIVGSLADAVAGKHLPAATGTSFRDWSQRLGERAKDSDVVAELPYWRTTLSESEPLLGSRRLDARDTAATTRTLTRTLNAPHLLTKVPALFRCGVNDILMTALAMAMQRPVLVDIEGHGREDEFVGAGVDSSQTVGWFTTLYPVRLATTAADATHSLMRVKEQLRSVPRNGMSFGLLRYLNAETAPELAQLSRPQISFNYLGRTFTSERADWSELDALGGGADAGMPTSHVLAINVHAAGDELVADWTWADGVLTEAEVDSLAAAWAHALAELATIQVGALTPSDVPLVSLTQDDFDGLGTGIADVLPTTALQEGLLFHALTAGAGADVYTLQGVLDLSGALDTSRLHAAANEVLRRHPTLRAAFRIIGGKAVQVIPATAEVPWVELDAVTEDEQDRIISADRDHRFDPAAPPLLQFTLLRIAPDQHRLVMTAHHLLLDGWSTPLLAKELFELYRGDSLTAPRPYRDYLTWLVAQDTASATDAWRKALAGVTEPTLVAPGAPPPSSARTEVEHSIPLEPLTGLARRTGVTLNTIVQTAWALTLSQLTGQTDVVFGQTVSGRPADLAGVESMIGLFINTVPVRTTLHAGEPLSRLLSRVQDEQAQLLPHHHLGLATIARMAGLSQLFDTLVVFENYPSDMGDGFDAAPGLTVTPGETSDATHYPLTLAVQPGDGLELHLEYHAGCVTRAQATEVLQRLTSILDGLTRNPEQFTAKLNAPTASPVVGAQIPVAATTIHGLFEAQAALTPEAAALVCGNQRLTFAEADERANRIAHELCHKGIGPEQFVALQVPRTADMIVAMLGVLKAGAAYLPIDPDYPEDRKALLLSDAAPAEVITAKWLDSDFAQWPSTKPNVAVSPDNPAYVIYTSGSTGVPKGVVVAHRSVVNLFHSHRETLYQPTVSAASGRQLKVAHTWSFAFDASWQPQLWMLDGHELHILGSTMLRDPKDLVNYVQRERIDFMEVSPSLAIALFESGLNVDCPLLALGVGGEPVPPSFWAAMRELPHTEGYNLYGPTETTVDALAARVSDHETPRVGLPTANTQAFVLDAFLRPVTPGVAGELYLAGAGLARGYLNRPALTADRFVANPFGTGRLYRTGDVVRVTPDGDFEHLGRTDDQLKVRGFRIEPGEIVAALESHPSVRRAVVMPWGGTRLAAYVVGNSTGVRDHVAEILPAHMVPAAVVAIDEIPLTPHGKVDYAALPAPELAVGRAPSGVLETMLCELFAEVLDAESVGADDDFFALGGHSLLAMRLRARIESALGCELSIAELLSKPTVSAVAAYLEPAYSRSERDRSENGAL